MVFLNLNLKLIKPIYKTISSNPYTNICESSKKWSRRRRRRSAAAIAIAKKEKEKAMIASNKQQQQQQTTTTIDEGNVVPTMEVHLCGGYLSFGYEGSAEEVLWWFEL